ncbi:MAG: hypothetical protein ACFCU3_07320 [Verrucomicrobiales bacterium]
MKILISKGEPSLVGSPNSLSQSSKPVRAHGARCSLAVMLSLLILLSLIRPLYAVVEDAISFALEAATPYVEEGFTVREEYWAGDLAEGESKAVNHQLYRGLEYWFWLGSDVEEATVSVHLYDNEGNLVEGESFQNGHLAGSKIQPQRTGTYFVVVTVHTSPEERTSWGLTYGFR